MRDAGVELRRAEIDREHAAAHEIAPYSRRSAVGDPERLSHRGARTVGADQEISRHLAARAVADTLDVGDNAAVIRDVADQPMSVAQLNAGKLRRVPTQDRLDEFLRHPVRQLCCAPRAGQTLHQFRRACRGRQLKTCQLMRRVAREIGDVGRVVRGQAGAPDLVGEAEPAEMLHRPRLRRVGLRVEGRSRLLVDQDCGHAAAAKLVGQHQPARTAAHDQHRGAQTFDHGASPRNGGMLPRPAK